MSLGLILVIILVIALLGGFCGSAQLRLNRRIWREKYASAC